MEKKYIVSKDKKTGLYYAHHKNFPNMPVCGSISEKRSDANEYAKMYNWLPNKVEQIEEARKIAWKKEMGLL